MATLMLLPSCFIFLLALTGGTWGHTHGRDVVRVVAAEGNDAILPCSLSSKENIVQQLFDWKKADRKEVFLYDAGIHYNNGRTGQDQQFKGRISHFQEQLKYGNASIMIHNTTMADSGNYTCAFPRLNPAQEFHIELVVERTLKDRSDEISGATRKPCVTISNVTDVGVRLKCEVQDAFPQPELQWQDSDGKTLPAEQPQVSERDGRYSIILHTTVTSTTTNRFRCEAKQEDVGHVVKTEITVPERLFEDKSCQVASWFIGGWFSGVLTVVVPLAVYVIIKYITKHWRKGSRHQGNGSCRQGNGSHQQENGSCRQGNGSHQQGNGSCRQGNGYRGVPLEPDSENVC